VFDLTYIINIVDSCVLVTDDFCPEIFFFVLFALPIYTIQLTSAASEDEVKWFPGAPPAAGVAFSPSRQDTVGLRFVHRFGHPRSYTLNHAFYRVAGSSVSSRRLQFVDGLCTLTRRHVACFKSSYVRPIVLHIVQSLASGKPRLFFISHRSYVLGPTYYFWRLTALAHLSPAITIGVCFFARKCSYNIDSET